jgi:hypothetical protein
MNAEERLLKYGYEDVKYLVNEGYDDALIGVGRDGRAIYDFDLMVKWLVDKYNCSESDAIEWIDYNCDIPYWEIVYREDIYESFPELSGTFDDYKRMLIGQNTHGVLLIDSESVTDQNIEDIESVLNNFEIDYKII